MAVIAHENSPVLRRIREFANALGDHSAKARLLSEPLPRKTGDRVPADLDQARFPTDVDLSRRDCARGLAQAERLIELGLERGFTFGDTFLPTCAYRRRKSARVTHQGGRPSTGMRRRRRSLFSRTEKSRSALSQSFRVPPTFLAPPLLAPVSCVSAIGIAAYMRRRLLQGLLWTGAPRENG